MRWGGSAVEPKPSAPESPGMARWLATWRRKQTELVELLGALQALDRCGGCGEHRHADPRGGHGRARFGADGTPAARPPCAWADGRPPVMAADPAPGRASGRDAGPYRIASLRVTPREIWVRGRSWVAALGLIVVSVLLAYGVQRDGYAQGWRDGYVQGQHEGYAQGQREGYEAGRRAPVERFVDSANDSGCAADANDGESPACGAPGHGPWRTLARLPAHVNAPWTVTVAGPQAMGVVLAPKPAEAP